MHDYDYSDLHYLPEINGFAYVYDYNLGLGIYLGFSPTSGYTYQFSDGIITAPDFKPLPTILKVQTHPFTTDEINHFLKVLDTWNIV